MSKPIHGIIHGKTIELQEDPGIADGETVEVEVRPACRGQKPWGDGIRRSAGGWADYPEMDEIMNGIHNDRQRERRTQEAE